MEKIINSLFDDDFLIKSFLLGDDSSFKILLEKYRAKMYHFFLNLVHEKDLADDYYQNVCINVFIALKNNNYNKNRGLFLNYYLKIAYNLYLETLLKQQNKIKPISTEYLDNLQKNCFETLPESSTLNKVELDYLQLCIKKLPNEQREILILRMATTLKFKEIANLAEISIFTCLSRMQNAIKNIRKSINSTII